MSLKEFLAAQKRLQESLYPTSLKELVETQNKLKLAIPYNSVKELKKFANVSNIENYSQAFIAIENATKILKIAEAKVAYQLKYRNYDLLKFVEEANKKEREEAKAVVVEQTKSVKKIITDIYKDNSKLLNIEPRQFEEMIAELLYSKGFEVELTKQTKDNGFDIIALKFLEKNFPLKFLVECKRFRKDKVGVEIVRSFKEVVQSENANKGIIATTSYFTRDANKKRLETPYLLDYKDKDDVLNWVAEYCVK